MLTRYFFAPQNGFDFVLTYFDDPKATIPSYCMNVITCSGTVLDDNIMKIVMIVSVLLFNFANGGSFLVMVIGMMIL